jgi:hypothetical protein
MSKIWYDNNRFHFIVEEIDRRTNRPIGYPVKFSPRHQMFEDLFAQMITAAASAPMEDQWFDGTIRLLMLARVAARERRSPRAGQVRLAELA